MFRLYESEKITDLYAKYRPTYPDELVSCILEFANKKNLAPPFDHVVDVGCGSGQATKLFATYAKKITGIDPSENQIKEAVKANTFSNIEYKTGVGEELKFENNSVDIITCGMSVHWLNFPIFLKECEKVLKPNGCVALFGLEIQEFLKINTTPTIKSLDKSTLSRETFQIFQKFVDSCVWLKKLWESKCNYHFNLLKSEDKLYKIIKVNTTWSLQHFQGFLQSVDGFQTYMNQKREELENKVRRKKIDADLLKHDISLQCINDMKKLWDIEENDNTQIFVHYNSDLYLVLSNKPL